MRMWSVVATRDDVVERRKSSYRYFVTVAELRRLIDEAPHDEIPVYFRRRQDGRPYLEIELPD
jgi:hypothetical protein